MMTLLLLLLLMMEQNLQLNLLKETRGIKVRKVTKEIKVILEMVLLLLD